jgi:hypothetical protein
MNRLVVYLSYFFLAVLITYLTSFYVYEIRATTLFIGNVEPLNYGVSGYPIYFQYKDDTNDLVIGHVLIDLFFWFGIVVMTSKAWDLLKAKRK